MKPHSWSKRQSGGHLLQSGQIGHHQRCGRLIETLPALQHDPNRTEDVLMVDTDEEGVGGDDCADCLRHLVATKTRRILAIKTSALG
jgi:hypothetical protein